MLPLQQCAAYPTGWSTGTWWWLRWLSDSCSSCQTCCGSEIFLCCNSWLKTHWDHQFSATFETISPWWASKHRNIGEIPQQSCRILKRWLNFPLRCMWPIMLFFRTHTWTLVYPEVYIFHKITGVSITQCLTLTFSMKGLSITFLSQGCIKLNFLRLNFFPVRGVYNSKLYYTHLVQYT